MAIGGLVAAYRKLEWYGVELESKFVALAEQNIALHQSRLNALGAPWPRIIQGDSRKFHVLIGESDAVVSSPPYADTQTTAGNVGNATNANWGQGKRLASAAEGYGEASGQIGRLKSGEVQAVISSPPYADTAVEKNSTGIQIEKQWQTYRSQGGGMSLEAFTAQQARHSEGYGQSSGQIAALKGGSVDACISSPPFSAPGMQPCIGQACRKDLAAKGKQPETNKPSQRARGNIKTLKEGSVDGVVSSPPWENNCEGGVKASKFNGYVPTQGKGHGSTAAARDAQATRDEQKTYGDSAGQIGQEKAESYWQAMNLVYRSCFQAIKPGGVIAIVVKDYCKAGKRVRLCDDTLKLLCHIGFTPLERIHAMLVSETVEAGLFGEERTKRQRKSFFRRLYEQKIPEGDERRIDHEEVLICRKPL